MAPHETQASSVDVDYGMETAADVQSDTKSWLRLALGFVENARSLVARAMDRAMDTICSPYNVEELVSEQDREAIKDEYIQRTTQRRNPQVVGEAAVRARHPDFSSFQSRMKILEQIVETHLSSKIDLVDPGIRAAVMVYFRKKNGLEEIVV